VAEQVLDRYGHALEQSDPERPLALFREPGARLVERVRVSGGLTEMLAIGAPAATFRDRPVVYLGHSASGA
jgi:hypothetical protein